MAKKVQKSASEQLIEEIQTLGQTQGLNNVFTTFLEMLAVSLNAQVDPRYAEEREKRYQQMVSGMSQEMLSTYARMFALMYMAVKEHSEEPSDILGSIYHRLGLNNEWNGQFFTDDHICRMMAMFVDPVDELPDEKPFTVNDKTTPRLIQFHTFKNAVNPPFLGGFSIFSTVAAWAERHPCQ